MFIVHVYHVYKLNMINQVGVAGHVVIHLLRAFDSNTCSVKCSPWLEFNATVNLKGWV